MDATARGRWTIALVVLAVSVFGEREDASTATTASPRETLRGIGRRLSATCSERELTAIATRGPELLARLRHAERRALARDYLCFQVDRPVAVAVAAPSGSEPFWLEESGFRPTRLTLANRDGRWSVYRRTYDRGAIRLGVNGLDRRPSAHYVVFVRARDDRAAEPRAATNLALSLESDPGSVWRIVTAKPGISAARDSDRPFVTMPAELAGSVMLQPSHQARGATVLAEGRTWKTHVVSTERPDQVVISFGADAGRELVWTWRTSAEVSSSAVRILPADELLAGHRPGGTIRLARGDSRLIEVANVLNDPVIRRHRVVVGGLEPGRAYACSLGDGSPEGWGPWQTVKTAPPRDRPTRFLYLGDAQTGLEGWGRLLEAAVRRHRDLDFLVLAGDLVDRGNERTNWDHFFLRAARVLDRLPTMPCVGNHEYLDVGPRLYRAFFELPGNGPCGIESDLVYAFEAGDACFAVLDSTLAVWDVDAARRQAEWLDQVLSRTHARWKIAIFHHPVYPSHPWRDMPALRQFWVPVFDRHGVDLVLQGHDHAYSRTYPLRAHRRAVAPDRGTIYAIAVSGDKFVEHASREITACGMSGVSTYQVIEIDPRSDRLSYEARTADGRVVDAFQLDRTPIMNASAARP